jgi:Cupin-like domain
VTGLHWDWPDNWLVQLQGEKELILFDRSQAEYLPLNQTYDYGAELCVVDITSLTGEAAARFRQARGQYVRLQPGDALFIPQRTFHAVISLTPSVSVSAFGHSLSQLLTTGLFMIVRDLLHQLGLWNGRRWGACTCHSRADRRPWAGRAILAALCVAAAAAALRRVHP